MCVCVSARARYLLCNGNNLAAHVDALSLLFLCCVAFSTPLTPTATVPASPVQPIELGQGLPVPRDTLHEFAPHTPFPVYQTHQFVSSDTLQFLTSSFCAVLLEEEQTHPRRVGSKDGIHHTYSLSHVPLFCTVDVVIVAWGARRGMKMHLCSLLHAGR